MKNRILFLIAAVAAILNINAQNAEDTKVILITLDGFRWQELFTGADSLLIGNKDYVHNAAMLKKAFWRNTRKKKSSFIAIFLGSSGKDGSNSWKPKIGQ